MAAWQLQINYPKLLSKYEKSIEEVNRIQNLEEYRDKLNSKLKNLKEEMKALCMQMNEIRSDFSRELEKKINNELKDLGDVIK